MKTTTVKKIPAKTIKETTQKIVTIVCDIKDCKELVTNHHYGYYGTCHICKRDICRRHTVYDPDETGDYPDNYCTDCARVFIPKRREMNERHWAEEKALEKEVKELSLAKNSGITVDNGGMR